MRLRLLTLALLAFMVSCKNEMQTESTTSAELETISEDSIAVNAAKGFKPEDLPKAIIDSTKAVMNEVARDSVDPAPNPYGNPYQNPYNNTVWKPGLRVEEKIYASWSGVKGCGERKTIDTNVAKALNDWAAKQMLKHSHLRLWGYGYIDYNGTVRSYKTWDNKRSCGAGVNIQCFIEFKHPDNP